MNYIILLSMINNLLVVEESLKLIIIRTIKLINIIKYKHKNNEDKIYIICNIEALNIIENQLDEIFSEEKCLKENINITIITEPLYRGIGSSICISSLLDIENNWNDGLFSETILEENTSETISFILPIDFIFDENEFILCCIKGIEYINNNIVTIGIKDKSFLYYEYGYIKMKNNELKIDYIEDFIKNLEYMKKYEYYSIDEYLFNSGIYIFKNKNVLDCYKKYSKDIYECCNNVLEQSLYNKIICKDNYKIINLEMKHYYNCRITSFEYSIMEYLIRDIYKNINSVCIKVDYYDKNNQ